MTRADEPAPTGTRLERALDLFLASEGHDGARLLREHPELRDLLEPMLDGTAPDAAQDDDVEVLGDFRLVRELGRGGMGIVYEAWQRSLDRRVAVKVLAPALVQNTSAVARFHREASAAGRLRHPHLVEVYGFGSANGQHFFAMQLVDGEPLQKCKARFREPAKALELAIQITDALVTAHAAGVVHRDVKPGNILIRADGTALLTDFGVASDTSLPSLTQAGGFVGTLDYASPEQVRGERADARADVWAMGVVLAELLTGTSPFVAATQQGTLRNILTAEPIGVAGAHLLSGDTRAVVLRALEKDLSRRYASAAALLADLRALRNGEPVTARLPNAFERVLRWTRREPWRAFAGIVMLAALAGGAAAIGFVSGKRPLIEAGERQAAEQAREQALGWAWLAAIEEAPTAAPARLAAAPDSATDPECRFAAAWFAVLANQPEAARPILADLQLPAARLLELEIARVERGDPPSALDHALDQSEDGDALTRFARGCLRYRNAVLSDNSRKNFVRAMQDFQASLLMSRTPRLYNLVMLMRAAAAAGEREQVAMASQAMRQRGAPSAFLLRAIVTSEGLVDPQAALATLDGAEGDDPWLQLARARMLFALRRYDEARQACDRYLAARGDDPSGWNLLGQIADGANDATAAREALEKAVAVDPGHVKAWNNLGTVLQRQGDAAGARAAFDRALATAPDYAIAHYNLGRVADAGGDWAKAEQHYRRAVAIDPGYAKAQINLATTLWRQRRRPEALTEARRGTQLAPDNPIAIGNVAQFAYGTGAYDEAERACARWLELAPNSAKAWDLRARLLFRIAEEDGKTRALAAARKATELSAGKDPEYLLLAAHGELVAGDREQAMAILDRLQKGLTDGSVPSSMQPRIELLARDLVK